MHKTTSPPLSSDAFRRTVMLVVMATSLLATLLAVYIEEVSGTSTPIWIALQALTIVVLSALLVVTWFKLLPQRVVELVCLICIVGVCAACMVVDLYVYGSDAGVYIEPLYLWIPLVYVFAFMLVSHRAGLLLSSAIFVLFVGISAPYLVGHIHGRYVNFTIQLHIASAVMIAMLYFFTSYQHRLRLAEQAVDRLEQLSSTDDLTRLANRREMASVIRAELALWSAAGRGFALLLFDVDHFKSINDLHGHAAGDRTMVSLAACAVDVLGGLGTVGRWGGDEFVALLPNTEADDALRMAEALCAHVATSGLAEGRQVTISCGVTVARERDSLDSLLQRVDAALYNAKRAGRNRAESIVEDGANVVAL